MNNITGPQREPGVVTRLQRTFKQLVAAADVDSFTNASQSTADTLIQMTSQSSNFKKDLLSWCINGNGDSKGFQYETSLANLPAVSKATQVQRTKKLLNGQSVSQGGLKQVAGDQRAKNEAASGVCPVSRLRLAASGVG